VPANCRRGELESDDHDSFYSAGKAAGTGPKGKNGRLFRKSVNAMKGLKWEDRSIEEEDGKIRRVERHKPAHPRTSCGSCLCHPPCGTIEVGLFTREELYGYKYGI
jgi:hypothetical protein